MSNYTYTLAEIIKDYAVGYAKENPGVKVSVNLEDQIKLARHRIFNFEYPIFDEDYREEIETKFLMYFSSYEIGQETVSQFLFYLRQFFLIEFPKFNKAYELQREQAEYLLYQNFNKKVHDGTLKIDAKGNVVYKMDKTGEVKTVVDLASQNIKSGSIDVKDTSKTDSTEDKNNTEERDTKTTSNLVGKDTKGGTVDVTDTEKTETSDTKNGTEERNLSSKTDEKGNETKTGDSTLTSDLDSNVNKNSTANDATGSVTQTGQTDTGKQNAKENTKTDTSKNGTVTETGTVTDNETNTGSVNSTKDSKTKNNETLDKTSKVDGTETGTVTGTEKNIGKVEAQSDGNTKFNDVTDKQTGTNVTDVNSSDKSNDITDKTDNTVNTNKFEEVDFGWTRPPYEVLMEYSTSFHTIDSMVFDSAFHFGLFMLIY